MKKLCISFCLLAVAVFAFSSCKDDVVDDQVLTCYTESAVSPKAYVNNPDAGTYKPMLVTGDSAYVNNGIFAFDFENGNPILRVNHAGDNRYRAIFPANIVNAAVNPDIAHVDDVSITVPRNQNYVAANGAQKVDMPMISYPQGYSLWFRNICSLVKVNATNNTNAPVTITSIEVANNSQGESGDGSVFLSGNTRVNTTASYPVCTVSGNPENRYVQLFMNGHEDATIAVGATCSYYLIVAPFSGATNMNVRINTTNGFENIPLPNVHSLDRNTVAIVNWSFL